MSNYNTENDGTCDNNNCDEVTPWDMVTIMFDGGWFCSPDCAREYLKEMNESPQTITLHDPQFVVPRDKFPGGVEEEDVNIQRPIINTEDGFKAIQEIESMYPREFRVELNK